MKYYVFDTDIAGFMQQDHPAVVRRVQILSADDNLATTIITFNEDISGWQAKCRRARNASARSLAYSRLQRALDFYCHKQCLPFDEASVKIFDQLNGQKIRIGANDLAIAAITLSVNGILVTRNVVDFQRIPGLPIEDWTK